MHIVLFNIPNENSLQMCMLIFFRTEEVLLLVHTCKRDTATQQPVDRLLNKARLQSLHDVAAAALCGSLIQDCIKSSMRLSLYAYVRIRGMYNLEN